ncbi:MAG: CotH kinase family protein, partial [Bacteroidota bacterium]|nr:CotH kinase family protein [Bacteroidota bacterium]
IELYNEGPTTFNVSGIYVTDDAAQPLKYALQGSAIIPAQGFLLIWAGASPITGQVTIPTGISIDGGFIMITAADGVTTLDNVQFGQQLTNVSFGRSPDGSNDWRFFTTPTPGATNNTSTGSLGFLSPPLFSVASGFFNAPFQLSINSADAGTTILYSRDGSTPSPELLDGEEYAYKNQYPELPGQPFGPFLQDTMRAYINSGSIAINNISGSPNVLSSRTTTFTFDQPPAYVPTELVRKATVIRARAFKDGYIPSEVVTHTYLITPDGGSPFELPVLSITTDKDHLFDHGEGIYTAGLDFDQWRMWNTTDAAHGQSPANWQRETEVPISFEWFENSAPASTISLNAGMRIHGGFSRSLKRKSLRVYFRSLYGEDEFEHPVFTDQAEGGYKRLIVHNAGNDESVANLRDMTLQAMMKHMHNETMSARSMVLFLNGEYWGVHALRERFDKHYLNRKYAIEEDELDILELKDLTVIEGDAVHYSAMMDLVNSNDLADDEDLAALAEMMDVDDFIDFQIAHIFTGNTDWPQNNVRMYRKRTSAYVPNAPHGHDGRWRWFLFDLDFGFNLTGTSSAGLQYLQRASTDSGFGLDPQYTLLFRKLLLNEQFRHRFMNRAADMINTAFRTSVTTSIIDEKRDLIAADMQEHFTRWLTGPGSNTAWENNLQVMYTFAAARPSAFRQEIRNRFNISQSHILTIDVSNEQAGYVHLNTIDLLPSIHGVDDGPYPWSGSYFDGIPVKLSAHALPGFQFVHWTGDVE